MQWRGGQGTKALDKLLNCIIRFQEFDFICVKEFYENKSYSKRMLELEETFKNILRSLSV